MISNIYFEKKNFDIIKLFLIEIKSFKININKFFRNIIGFIESKRKQEIQKSKIKYFVKVENEINILFIQIEFNIIKI